jgi:hypothetical protein
LPDTGCWQVLIPVTRNNSEWCGRALIAKGNSVTVYYDPKIELACEQIIIVKDLKDEVCNGKNYSKY